MNEVLKQMVEALEWCHGGEPIGTADAIQAGKKLIAELESQEPVAWISKHNVVYPLDAKHEVHPINELKPLFTHPPQRTEQELAADDFFKMIADSNPKPFPSPQRTWVGLTDDDIDFIYTGIRAVHHDVDSYVLCRAVEARLKEKNS